MKNEDNWWNELIKKRKEESIGLIKVKNIISNELYPDNAHFIYELLQNAEDTAATNVSFELFDDKLIFKHNGKRLFTQKDINAITDINNFDSNLEKKERFNEETIGKFGIGFKAVFTYTDTPQIYSGKYAFEIYNLVVPRKIKQISNKNNETIMIFPFNNKEKSQETAFAEIKQGLSDISDNTLMFLDSIKTINYKFENVKNTIEREDLDEIKINILNNYNETLTSWLRFKKNISNSDKLFVSCVFKLEEDEKTKQDIIVPIDGKVSIYFPADKETSNLKFHIHAPFASTVARDSIKDDKSNNQFIGLISELVCDSLKYIKEKNLLNFSFLRCMPIEDDNLEDFYKPIQNALIDYFNSNELILTDDKLYKPASKCYRSSKEIKDLLDIELFKLLIDEDDIFWIKNPPLLNSREDKFLQLLDIKSFEDDDFLELLDDSISIFQYDDEFEDDLNKKNMISQKDDAWFGKLYAYLYRKNGSRYYSWETLIKLSDGSLCNYGETCYFSENISDDFRIVKLETYTANNKKTNKEAKQFLIDNGVKEIGEKEKIELILRNYYSTEKLTIDNSEHLKHIELFINYYNNNPEVNLFKRYKIFLDEDNILHNANSLIIDDPYFNFSTTMKLLKQKGYFNDYKKYIISEIYLKIQQKELFIKFVKEIGIWWQLRILKRDVRQNDLKSLLLTDLKKAKVRYETKINEDFTIQGIIELEKYKDFDISLLIWEKMINAHKKVLSARYRPNKQYPTRKYNSLLIQSLQKYEWIPDKKNNFYKPEDISQDMLPKEFVYDNQNGWLSAIKFGENIKRNSEKYREKEKHAKEMSGLSCESLEKIKKAKLTDKEINQMLEEKEKKSLRKALSKNQSDGNSPEFIQAQNNETIILDNKKYEKEIHKINKNHSEKITSSTTKYTRQDSKEEEKIKDFLYKEYEGHCQICGDTFSDGHKNIYVKTSLNISKNRDVIRKGNSLSLCHKHYEIFKRKLQKNLYLEKIKQKSKLNIDNMDKIYEKYDWVDKDDQKYINDSFYRLNKEDNFIRDEIYFLPIRLFKKEEYIKFTKAHMMEFITVWNNN